MDFTAAINSIRTALYGSEVRESIAQAMEYVKSTMESGITTIQNVLKQAQAARDAASTSASNAVSSASAASTSASNAASSASAAKSSQTAAASSASAAKTSETNAASSASAAKTSEANAKKYSEEAGAKAGTDKTLSIEDAPADAKQVGVALTAMYTKKGVQKLIEDSLAAYRAEEYAKIKFWVSDDPTSPAELFGGTWERIEGEFILGASDAYPAGSTGGEAEVTLIEDQLPVIDGTWMCPVPNNHADFAVTGHAYGYDHNTSLPSWWGGGSDGIQWGYGYKFGGGMSHNNLPPYYSVYIWRRVDAA